MNLAKSGDSKHTHYVRPIIHDLNATLTDLMTVDGFSPPQASRCYYYANVGFYEVLRQTDSMYLSLAGQINELPKIEPANSQIDYEYAAALVFREIGSTLVYRSEKFKGNIDQLLLNKKNVLSDNLLSNSEEYSEQVTKQILTWINGDHYQRLKSYPRYQLLKKPWSWEPTPPVYMDALEPNWKFLRTASIDSNSQFLAALPIPFDTIVNSRFYLEALEVYDLVKENNEQTRMIAGFWDCNPLQTVVSGHFMIKEKQMTPGGHWMAISGIVCADKKLNALETSAAYTNVSIGLYDGFISAWVAKYKYNLIRPITYIHRYIDSEWTPILETPPFPEYTSAHSLISRCSSEILTKWVGDDFEYIDTVETRWGYPARVFASVNSAAEEVSRSRVYGGIHFRSGVEVGMKSGEQLGKFINQKIIFKLSDINKD